MMLWDALGLRTLSHMGDMNGGAPIWNVEGELVFGAYSSGGSAVTVWDGGGLRLIIEGLFTRYNNFLWSTDGQLAFQACLNATCDLMVWDRQTVHNLTQGSARDVRQQWNDSGALIFTVCSGSVRAPCDLRMWDGSALVSLTNTPSVNEYTVVWLP
jgi:hypothetical protein